jgi:hypothetical protein
VVTFDEQHWSFSPSASTVVAYVRTVKTASGATAVQIVWSTRCGSRQIEHLGSAHHDAEVEHSRLPPANAWPKARAPWIWV